MIDDLKKVINVQNNKINISLTNDSVVLKETHPDAKLKKIDIKGLDSYNTLAFKLDVRGKRISEYLNPSTPEINKACDGIIFTSIEDKWYIFICEMKSDKPKYTEVIAKYKNTKLFVHFILSLLEEYYDYPQKPEIKYVLFDTKKGSNKTPTKVKKLEANKIDGYNIYQVHKLRDTEFLNIRYLKL